MAGVEYQVTKVDPTDPETKGMVYQVHKVSEEIAATLGGKVYRARIINDPTDPTVAGKVYQIVLIGDPDDPAVKGKVYNAILTGGSEAVVVGPAVSPLALPDAIADSLVYVKAFGGTGQNGTPTPDAPVDIVSNNGVLKTQGSATGTVTQTGDPTPTTPVEPVFYQNHGLLLRAIGEDADTYDASTQTITRAIGYHIFDGTETFGSSTAYGKALYISSASSAWGADRYKDVLCQYFLGTSSPSSSMPEFSCFFNTSRHFYFRTEETATNFKAWLAELYANGTPLIVWFVKSASTTESFTPSVYADGTVETIEDTIGNTATTETLLKVGDYQDEQEILSGAITRKVGVKVLDGTEAWSKTTDTSVNRYQANVLPDKASGTITCLCSHFQNVLAFPDLNDNCFIAYATARVIFDEEDITTLTDWQQWLADQYAAGTPVIIVYPLATPATESVAGQTLQVQDGDNTLEITQASLTGLELEAQYQAAVTLIVQEAEDANLDNNVTVTIQ